MDPPKARPSDATKTSEEAKSIEAGRVPNASPNETSEKPEQSALGLTRTISQDDALTLANIHRHITKLVKRKEKLERAQRRRPYLKNKPKPVILPKMCISPSFTEFDRGVAPDPKEFDNIFDSEAEIIVLSGTDSLYQIRHKLNLEFQHVPLTNPMLEDDSNAKEDMGNNITLVYITRFFDDDTDFAYYVKGSKNMANFLRGTYGTGAYDGPCFATPCLVHNALDIFATRDDDGVHRFNYDRVQRDGMNKVRWKYLFESGVKAYDKLDIDWDKAMRIKYQIQNAMRYDDFSDWSVSDDAMEVEEVPDEDEKAEMEVEEVEVKYEGKGKAKAHAVEEEKPRSKGKDKAKVIDQEQKLDIRRDSANSVWDLPGPSRAHSPVISEPETVTDEIESAKDTLSVEEVWSEAEDIDEVERKCRELGYRFW